MDFKEYIAGQISSLTGIDIGEIRVYIEVPPRKEMGDFAFPCFRLAKPLRKAPPIIASELAAGIATDSVIERVLNEGGYLNFFINKQSMVESVLKEILFTDSYGSSNEGEGKVVVLDFSSPNIAKPFHVGHLRSTVIGAALHRIYNYLGYKSVGINHLGDWGTQFGKEIVAYKLWGSEEKVKKNPIEELLDLYVKFHDEAEKNPSLEDDARLWFKKLEEGDEEATALWQWFRDVSLLEFNRIYDKLSVSFDSYAGESFYNDKMDRVVHELEEKNLLVRSEGADIVDLSEYNLPPCLIRKSDGATLYATRDIAALLYRKDHYNFAKALYVVGDAQSLHFKQIFAVVEKMGYDIKDKLEHVSFGLIKLESGKMATRKGKAIFLEDVLDQAVEVTKEIIEKKNPNLQNKEEVAKMVGIGAIIFNDLSNNKIKDVIFSWESVLNFDGETGPYVQYTYARASSLIRKGGEVGDLIDYSRLNDEASLDLVKELEGFKQSVKVAADKYEPSIITRKLIDIAQAFNRFYHDNPILVEDESVKNSRLALVEATRRVIKQGLTLIGLKAPEQM